MTPLLALLACAAAWIALSESARRAVTRDLATARADADTADAAAASEKREHRKTAVALVAARQEVAGRDAIARQCCAVCRELRIPTHVDIRPN